MMSGVTGSEGTLVRQRVEELEAEPGGKEDRERGGREERKRQEEKSKGGEEKERSEGNEVGRE